MLRFISYAREVAPPQASEDDWRAYWIILDDNELVKEGRSKQTFATKSRAIGYADAAMADWYADYQDTAANAANPSKKEHHMKKAVTLKEGVFPGPTDFHNIPVLIAVEECIAWAAQHGYIYADKAAAEYGRHSGREMVEDQNTGYYNTRSWQFKK